MNIIWEEVKTVPFKALSCGDCFAPPESMNVYMKIESYDNVNHVCLRSGAVGYMDDEDEVYVYNCDLIVKN